MMGFIRLLIWAAAVQKGKACACRRRGEIAQGVILCYKKTQRRAIWLELCIYRPDTE